MRKLFEMSFDPQITNVFLVPISRQDIKQPCIDKSCDRSVKVQLA